LGRLRRLPADNESVKEELDEIIANHEFELSVGKSNWRSIIQKAGSQRKRLFTGCMIMAGSQLTGINFIFYYGTQFFKNSGISNPFLIGLTTNLVNVFSTLPGLYLVEKWGRRPVLLFGAIGMTVCELIVAIVGVTADSQIANKVLIAFVCFYIFFFACSWGPVGWVVVVCANILRPHSNDRSLYCSLRERSSPFVSAPNPSPAPLPVTGSLTGLSATLLLTLLTLALARRV
jgi:MFS transporter, SP family, sugar:H+ symporter